MSRIEWMMWISRRAVNQPPLAIDPTSDQASIRSGLQRRRRLKGIPKDRSQESHERPVGVQSQAGLLGSGSVVFLVSTPASNVACWRGDGSHRCTFMRVAIHDRLNSRASLAAEVRLAAFSTTGPITLTVETAVSRISFASSSGKLGARSTIAAR